MAKNTENLEFTSLLSTGNSEKQILGEEVVLQTVNQPLATHYHVPTCLVDGFF